MTNDGDAHAGMKPVTWPGIVALVGAALPWLLVGTTLRWWLNRGRPSGGDVLWLYVILMVPALVVGAIMTAIGIVWCARADRAGHLSNAARMMRSASLLVVILTIATAGVLFGSS